MEFSDIDLKLFRYLKKRMHDAVQVEKLTAYTMEAKLLWAGAHYLLVKSGPHQGRREVEIWSREALLLKRGNPFQNAMFELALATIDPVHKSWMPNYRRLVWRSGGSGDVKKFAKRRWGKRLRKELIDFCKVEEYFFEDREAEEIRRQQKARDFVAATVSHVEELGLEVAGGEPKPGKKYETQIEGDRFKRLSFSFRPRADKKINFSVINNRLTPEEFKLLAETFAEISRRREEEFSEESND